MVVCTVPNLASVHPELVINMVLTAPRFERQQISLFQLLLGFDGRDAFIRGCSTKNDRVRLSVRLIFARLTRDRRILSRSIIVQRANCYVFSCTFCNVFR